LVSLAAVALLGSSAQAGVAADATGRATLIRQAAQEFGVPESVLLAVSYSESRWENHRGRPSSDGGFGLMDLTTVATVPDGRGKAGDPVRVVDTAFRHTLDRASQLLSLPVDLLERDDRENVRGGAAVLAQYARDLNGGRLPSAVGDWYAAVARYSGATDSVTAGLFADDVFTVIRDGAVLTTTDGQVVALPATPEAQESRDQIAALHLNTPARPSDGQAECPVELHCAFLPAAYQQNNPNDPGDYGNYDTADRPATLAVRYIVIHDTEGSYAGTLSEFQNPLAYVSAHYVIRSSDGAVTQMVPTKDVAWHAGNWWLNAHSIGIEHEGFAVDGASWFTEAMYRSSARLVRYLAAKYNIPLDREHILGHDNVVGPTPATVAGMHWDPGPFWDWDHYMQLLRGPVRPIAPAGRGLVTIAPSFRSNRPVVTDCGSGTCVALPPQPSNFVYLRTGPSDSAALLSDAGLRPDGSPGTTEASDWSDKAVAGQQFAVYARRGDWVGIWFGGQVGWFFDPHGRASVAGCGWVVTPVGGVGSIPVYGRAYPEAEAYPAQIPVQAVTPLQYTLSAGQKYSVGLTTDSEYYWATTFDASNHTVVRGKTRYVQIQFGHRVMYVNAADVDVRPSVLP